VGHEHPKCAFISWALCILNTFENMVLLILTWMFKPKLEEVITIFSVYAADGKCADDLAGSMNDS
jgi:hypothetical protein